MILRPYQQAALHTSKSMFAGGVTRQLIALPTGTGKTPTFAALKDFFGFKGKIMVLVHREELADQAADKICKWNPGARVGIEMGDRWATSQDDFVVASVQTLGRANNARIARFKPDEFSAIVVMKLTIAYLS
jgi:ATP-dependent helicase IRC3